MFNNFFSNKYSIELFAAVSLALNSAYYNYFFFHVKLKTEEMAAENFVLHHRNTIYKKNIYILKCNNISQVNAGMLSIIFVLFLFKNILQILLILNV